MQRASPIIIHQLSFALPNGVTLFNDLTFTFSHSKTGLVGRNGTGKTTLVKLIRGELTPKSGNIQVAGKIGYVPQNPIVQPTMTVAGLLGIEQKLAALQRIKQGGIATQDFTVLNALSVISISISRLVY